MPPHVAMSLALLTGSAGYFGPVRPPAPNPGAQLPPSGCRYAFPPYAWCREQLVAAEAFEAKCERVIRGDLGPRERDRWRALQAEARRGRAVWGWLAQAQDPANAGTEDDRRLLLLHLHDVLGPDAFFAGRMPPAVPPGAPVD